MVFVALFGVVVCFCCFTSAHSNKQPFGPKLARFFSLPTQLLPEPFVNNNVLTEDEFPDVELERQKIELDRILPFM